MTSLSEVSEEEIDAADRKIQFLVQQFGEDIRSDFEDYTDQQAMTLTAIVLTELVTRWMMSDGDGKVTTAKLNRLCAGIRTCAKHYKANPFREA